MRCFLGASAGLLLALGHLAGCGDGPCVSTSWFADGDGDGFGSTALTEACVAPEGYVATPGDCDDGDPSSHPGAAEGCSGDHDCDGTPDDAAPPIWYRDEDDDGYGVADVSLVQCHQPTGYALAAGDCDDANPLVSPAGYEDCAQVDRDCDGDPTEGALDARSYFVDDDLDADGPYASRVVACTSPGEAWVSSGKDCDDADPARSGNFTELPYDGIDNDCNTATRDDDLDDDGLAIAADCDDTDDAIGVPVPLAPSFIDVAVVAGLSDPVVAEPPTSSACDTIPYVGGGVAAGDYDGDGDVDLFIVPTRAPARLLANDGDGVFADVTEASGIEVGTGYAAAVFFDHGADGDLDLFVVPIGRLPTLLYVQEAGIFAERSAEFGASIGSPGSDRCLLMLSVSAGDVDGDGDVDLLLPSLAGLAPSLSTVLLDDGTGHYDVGPSSLGLGLDGRFAYTASLGDVTGDGRQDVAIAADYGTSALFSADGMGTFTNVTAASQVGTDENGMGSVLADYDGDLDLDWFVTSIASDDCTNPFHGCTGNRLYRNDGSGVFDDVTDLAGVRDGAWGWGAQFFDFDNDGDLDLGHTNGFPLTGFAHDRARLFVAVGGGTFDERACRHGIFAHGQGRAFVPVDADRDGDLDVLTTETGSRPILYRNQGIPAHAWLTVRLVDGTTRNREALGASVYVRALAGGPTQRRDVHANSTFAGVGPAEAHFGFGAHLGDLDRVVVSWPDGVETTLNAVATDQVLTITR